MATEWVDIVDTAVKIGLGAIISGVSTYYVTTMKNQHERNQETRALHRDIILQAGSYADEYFDYTYSYFSRLSAIVENREDFEFSEEHWKKSQDNIHEIDSLLDDARKKIYTALSKLELLGLIEASEQLESYRSGEVELRQFYRVNENCCPSREYLEKWGLKYVPIKKLFRKSLSKAFLELT